MADNSVRSNERQFEQIKDFLANYQTMLTTLQRSAGNKGFKDNGIYQQTESALKKMVEEAEKVKSAADVPTFIAAMAKQFENAKTPIESVSDALNAVKTKIGETKAEADKFNGALKSQRDVNTYIKSVSNSLYTAQRYLSNNSKITTDPAIYARYQHVGDGISSVNDASESIISTMKAFGVEAKDVTSIVDKFNEVGNNYAISSAGVGSALQRSASALHTAGNTLDQSIGMIVAANDVAQDPESVGNALKVLSLRIRGAKTDLEQMGESTDDVAVSTSKLREQIKALTNVDGKGGFDILTKSGDFKSTYEIMEGIANVWKEMNDVDKASLLEQVAGKNRANVVSGMLDNWKDAQNAAKTAAESAGSATKENETYLDSINGKISQFTAAFEKLSKDVLDSDLIKFFIELATHIANLADEAVKLVDNIGLIPTAIGGIGAALGVSLIKNKGTSGKLYARLHKGNSCVGCRCQIIKYPNCWERLRAA